MQHDVVIVDIAKLVQSSMKQTKKTPLVLYVRLRTAWHYWNRKKEQSVRETLTKLALGKTFEAPGWKIIIGSFK